MQKTAEFVSPKHPDKICDLIADSILDAYLAQDPNSRVAVEVMGGHGRITVSGEVTSHAKGNVDIAKIVQTIVGPTFEVHVKVVPQSSNIAQGVDIGGAGDQGIMVGYACSETANLMPLEYELARNLCKDIYAIYPFDGKVQVTIEDHNPSQPPLILRGGAEPSSLTPSVSQQFPPLNLRGGALERGLAGELYPKVLTVVASFQNSKTQELLELVKSKIQADEYLINPAGEWTLGGFDADSGLSGRKIIIDNYGPNVPVGGGSFSGKDYTKVDRSGAYMARKIAVDILKASSAREILVKLAYAIGKPEPVMGTVIRDSMTVEFPREYNLTPKGIKEFLKLDQMKFVETSAWGHFGRGFTWDK